MTARLRIVLFTLLILGVSLLYFPLNRAWGTVHSLATPWDANIPELPMFVIPYLGTFLLMIGGGISWTIWKRREVFWRLGWSIILAEVIAYVVYLIFQTAVPRQPTTDPSMFGAVLNWIRNTDRWYSAFPSGHAFLTTIFTWHLWAALPKWWRPILIVNAAAIIAATLFLRQHYLADPLAGLVLGLGASWVVRGAVARNRKPSS